MTHREEKKLVLFGDCHLGTCLPWDDRAYVQSHESSEERGVQKVRGTTTEGVNLLSHVIRGATSKGFTRDGKTGSRGYVLERADLLKQADYCIFKTGTVDAVIGSVHAYWTGKAPALHEFELWTPRYQEEMRAFLRFLKTLDCRPVVCNATYPSLWMEEKAVITHLDWSRQHVKKYSTKLITRRERAVASFLANAVHKVSMYFDSEEGLNERVQKSKFLRLCLMPCYTFVLKCVAPSLFSNFPSIQVRTEFVRKYNKLLAATCQQEGVLYVDSGTSMLTKDLSTLSPEYVADNGWDHHAIRNSWEFKSWLDKL